MSYGPPPPLKLLQNADRRRRVESVRLGVARILENNLLPHFTDHSVKHSDRLTELVDKLGQSCIPALDDREASIVYLACYFHDLGMQWESAGSTETIIEAGLSPSWDTMPEDERREALRKYHNKISAEAVVLSTQDSDFLGIQLEESDDPELVAQLCHAHTVNAPSEEYDQLMEGPSGVRLKLISGLLRMADILDETSSRALRPRANSLRLDAVAELHWWRHHYTREVDFRGDGQIVVRFDYPKLKRGEYHLVVSNLQLPEIVSEIERHRNAFAIAKLTWRIQGEVSTAPHPVVKDMGADVFARMKRLVYGDPPPTTSTDSSVDRPAVAPYTPDKRPMFVPYPAKGAGVRGRTQSLERLREVLRGEGRTSIGHAAAFLGMGGLGKTQLAVEYAHLDGHNYSNGVVWIQANADLDSQLSDLAVKAEWVAPETDPAIATTIARQRILTYPHTLLIFDNVEDLSTIAGLLPDPNLGIHVVLTSRNEQTGFTPVPISLLNDDDSRGVLLDVSGRGLPAGDERVALDDLVKQIDGLPLALELAGAYLRYRSGMSWREYTNLFRSNAGAALPQKYGAGSFTKHDGDVWAALRIGEEVWSQEPILEDALKVLTWSGNSPMGLKLLAFLTNAPSETELIAALRLAESLRIVSPAPDRLAFVLHALVREAQRRAWPIEEMRPWAEVVSKRVGEWFQNRRELYEEVPSAS